MDRLHDVNINTQELADSFYVQNTYFEPIDGIASIIKHIFKPSPFSALDIGCGTGYYLPKIFYPQPVDIWGLDYSSVAINYCIKNYPLYHFVQHDITKFQLPFDNNKFDYVFIAEVLEHMESPGAIINECFRVLKHGGIIIATTPFEDLVPVEAHLWKVKLSDLPIMFPQFINQSYFRFTNPNAGEHWEHFCIIGEKQ